MASISSAVPRSPQRQSRAQRGRLRRLRTRQPRTPYGARSPKRCRHCTQSSQSTSTAWVRPRSGCRPIAFPSWPGCRSGSNRSRAGRVQAVPGLVPTRTFYGSLSRACLPVDAVRAPPFGALLHAGARCHSRDDRPCQFAGVSATCGPVRGSRTSESPGHDRLATRSVQPGVLVHVGVRRRMGSRRATNLRRRACSARLAKSNRSETARSESSTRWRCQPAPTTSPPSKTCSSPQHLSKPQSSRCTNTSTRSAGESVRYDLRVLALLRPPGGLKSSTVPAYAPFIHHFGK